MTPPAELAALLREPWAHDFFATLRELQTRLEMPPIGAALRPGEERVRFGQEPALTFAPSTISAAKWNEERRRLELTMRFTGLLGPNGPLPIHVTEYIIDRKRHHDDRTLEAFLNIFHHRIYALFFRAWALAQPTVDFERAAARKHVFFLRSLVGLGTAGTESRDSVPDAARLYYSGWLGGLSRSPAGLASILADFLRVPAEVRSFQGMWLDLPHDSRCRLGESPRSGVIGVSCFAGERIWVAHLKFRLRFGPLSWRDYENLLPGGAAFQQVTEWIRFYFAEELTWEAQLVLRRSEAPECRLGGGVRLGWSTWIGSPPADRDLDDLVVQAA